MPKQSTAEELIAKLDALIERRGYRYENAMTLIGDRRVIGVLKRKKYVLISAEDVEKWLRRL